ncbi:rubredoxin [Pseudomonas syringae]|uniref:rubredoxin n=1 Tax=Pseudomonas syringae TaxID=317 RepID=UPI001F1783FC|nr:rubredoxin [Pseudomonas syringae]MCF5705225.1 rubredoxin [Pseudomonas syringae]
MSSETSEVLDEVQFKVWQCILCGFMYEEEVGIPEEGIPAGTRWEDVPEDWICPECSATKQDFEMIEI